MAQMNATVYVRAKDSATHRKVGDVIRTIAKESSSGWESLQKALTRSVTKIDAKRADKLVRQLRNDMPESFSWEGPGRYKCGGYWAIDLVFGSGGESCTRATVNFLGKLGKGVDARAFLGCDEWEMFFRFVGSKATDRYYVPLEDRERDLKALKRGGTYAWWHNGLPDTVKAGVLNDPDIVAEHWADLEEPVAIADIDDELEGTAFAPLANSLRSRPVDINPLILSFTNDSLLGMPLVDLMSSEVPGGEISYKDPNAGTRIRVTSNDLGKSLLIEIKTGYAGYIEPIRHSELAAHMTGLNLELINKRGGLFNTSVWDVDGVGAKVEFHYDRATIYLVKPGPYFLDGDLAEMFRIWRTRVRTAGETEIVRYLEHLAILRMLYGRLESADPRPECFYAFKSQILSTIDSSNPEWREVLAKGAELGEPASLAITGRS